MDAQDEIRRLMDENIPAFHRSMEKGIYSDRKIAADLFRSALNWINGLNIVVVASVNRAEIAEAEVAMLRARVAELEAADQWRPVSEPPVEPGYYQTYTVSPPVLDHCYYNNADGWSSRYAHPDFWRPLPSPPQEAPAA